MNISKKVFLGAIALGTLGAFVGSNIESKNAWSDVENSISTLINKNLSVNSIKIGDNKLQLFGYIDTLSSSSSSSLSSSSLSSSSSSSSSSSNEENSASNQQAVWYTYNFVGFLDSVENLKEKFVNVYDANINNKNFNNKFDTAVKILNEVSTLVKSDIKYEFNIQEHEMKNNTNSSEITL